MEQTNMVGTASPQQSVKGLSFKGIFQVFYQPTEFFTKLRNQPKILVPYFVLAVVFFVGFYLIGDLAVQMQLDSPQAQERLQGQQITDQLREIMRWQTVIIGTIALLLGPMVSAVLCLFVGNFLMGLNARFKQIISVMLYGNIIYAIGFLVLTPLMLAKQSMFVSLSLGVLVVDQAPDGILYLIMSKIGVFIIWEIIAVGIGLAAAYNIPRNKGYLVSVLSVGMLSILHVVFTVIGKAIF